jgi:hypothetical protein
MKLKPGKVAEPAKLATETFPVAPAATTAVMEVLDIILKEAAGTPPKLTEDAPRKLVPVMVI